jgi:septum site-determining protein MinD
MLALDDTLDILGIDLIGVVPEDEKIIRSSNMGEPIVMNDKAPAGKAYRNVTKRIMGDNVPLMDLNDDSGLGSVLRRLLRGK